MLKVLNAATMSNSHGSASQIKDFMTEWCLDFAHFDALLSL